MVPSDTQRRLVDEYMDQHNTLVNISPDKLNRISRAFCSVYTYHLTHLTPSDLVQTDLISSEPSVPWSDPVCRGCDRTERTGSRAHRSHRLQPWPTASISQRTNEMRSVETRSDKNRNLNSHIDLHTHAGCAFDNRVTLTFDLLTRWSMHAEDLPWSICVYQVRCW